MKHQGTKLHLTNMDTNELLLQFYIIFPLVRTIKEDIDGRMFGKNNINSYLSNLEFCNCNFGEMICDKINWIVIFLLQYCVLSVIKF